MEVSIEIPEGDNSHTLLIIIADIHRILCCYLPATSKDIDVWSGPVTKEIVAQWIQGQMKEPLTSHRAYLRKRLNPRLNQPNKYIFNTNNPCNAGSRWRKFTFSKQDGHHWWMHSDRKIGLKGDGPYVITLDGYARTTVSIAIAR